MRSPHHLQQILDQVRRKIAHMRADRTAGPGNARGMFGRARVWLAGAAALLGVSWVISSCVVQDLEYCAVRSQCPFVQTDMGAVQLLCHPTRHVCLPNSSETCFTDMDCPDPAAARCDTDKNVCVGCIAGDGSACGHLGERKLCVNAQSGSGTVCVACQTNMDCPNTAPICDNQLCRKCSSHQDCEGKVNCDSGGECTDSMVCISEDELPGLGGRCAQNGAGQSGRVVYVNNTESYCSQLPMPTYPAGAGNQFSPALCFLDDAMMQAKSQGRRFIRMVGNDYYPVQKYMSYFMADAYTFIGAPTKTKPFPNQASIHSMGLFFDILGTGSVSLDQLTLIELNIGGGALQCRGSAGIPGLFVRHCQILGMTPPTYSMTGSAAILVNSCNTVLDGNIIGNVDSTNSAATAHGRAVVLIDTRGSDNASSVLVQNNIIAGNAGVGIDLTGASSATNKFVLRFNTIVNNGRGTTTFPGGVNCPSGSPIREFSHSIIYGNALLLGSQILEASPQGCNFKDVIIGTTDGNTMDPAFIKKDPQLDPTTQRLVKNSKNSDCCIDQVLPTGTETLPTEDIDGVARPQNKKWDIGASELRY